MIKTIKKLYFYSGIPIIGAALLIVHMGKTDAFIMLWRELLVIFGYVAAALDIKTKKIPNNLVLVMLSAWALAIVPKLFVDIEAATALLKDSLLGFLVGGGLFLLVYLISRKGLGGGDVKFMAAAGLYIGFAGTLSSMLYGTVLAGLVGLILLLLKKIGRKDAIPLAPFLYIGILITIFCR